jgi:pimeloyl-ACP methyl ester carboxylesterase
MRPWGFRVEEVGVPVRLWHGTEDRLTPPEMARWLAERLPDARIDWLEGAGHAAWLRHGERILSEPVTAAG